MFKKIKENWQRRIEKNAFKSTLSYKDRKGIYNEEEVYFKRSLLPLGDWGRIYPPIKEDREKVHWTNLIFGGWRNFVKLLIVSGIIVTFVYLFLVNLQVIEFQEATIETLNATCQGLN